MFTLVCSSLLALCAIPSHANSVHPEVQAALDWQLPEHDCGAQPRMRKGSDYANETHETVHSDTDTYTRKRYQRKMKRWDKCMGKYRNNLIKEFGRLKDSVRHGMTPAQAELVLTKLKLIQDTLALTTANPKQAR